MMMHYACRTATRSASPDRPILDNLKHGLSAMAGRGRGEQISDGDDGVAVLADLLADIALPQPQ